MSVKITTTYADGRVEVRDATNEEIAKMEADAARAAEEQAQREAAIAVAEATRASALAKLTALGLTEEEAAAIIK